MSAIASEFFGQVRSRVDAHLSGYFAAKRAEVARLSPNSVELVDAIATLTMRGGKRLRPIVLAAAYRAAGGHDLDTVVAAGAAMELLQTYLLVHDDWMDRDDERRGGPAVHAAFRASRGDAHLGDCLGILAGDLASTYAWELFLEAPFPVARRAEGARAFLALQKEVYLGQHLDVTGDAEVERMHDLKTGSYTVRGPLTIGALLADASERALADLLAWGAPLGEAFQLADDLLGTFGDVAETGKPGDDLRHGKRTSLVREAERTLGASDRAALERVLGRADASEDEVRAAASLLERTGVRGAVERRLAALHEASERVLAASALAPDGTTILREVGSRLAKRSR